MQRRPEIEEEMFTWLLPISVGVVNYRTGKRDQTWQTCVSNLYNGFSASPASAKRCPLSTLSRNKSKFAPARRIPIWKMMKTENNDKAISKQTLNFSLGYHARSLSNHFWLQSGWKLKATRNTRRQGCCRCHFVSSDYTQDWELFSLNVPGVLRSSHEPYSSFKT